MRFHIVGIGGVGMSAVARLLMARGDTVSGSDRGEWPLAAALAADGATVAPSFARARANGHSPVSDPLTVSPRAMSRRATADMPMPPIPTT